MKAGALELIDFERIDVLLEGFNKTTGFVTAILDLEGNVLSKSGWRKICTDFHRINNVTAGQCTVSDTVLAGKMKKGEEYHFYKCLNGLVDVAVPLVIRGEHVANLFSGQFFFEKPDLTFFKKHAEKYGFEEKSYLDALSKVPVISKEKVRIAMDFLRDMTQLISELAYQKGALDTLNINIRESEELFKTVFESANVGKSITLPEGEMTVNESFCRMLGYSREELKNRKWQDLTPHEEIREIEAHLDRLLKGEEESTRFEKRYIRKDGSFIWADVSVFLSRDTEGKPKFFITTTIDISEQKRAKNELLANEEKYSSFFINSFHAILLSAPDGSILAANPAACEMFGKSEEEIISGGREGLVDVSDPRLKPLLAERLKMGKAKGELTFFRADGSRFQAEVSSALFTDSRGAARSILIINDITERLKGEEARRISEEKYMKIFQASPDLIILTSLKEGIIVDINERIKPMTGYSREELIGEKSIGMNLWADPAERDAYIAALLENGSVRDRKAKFRIKSGEIRDALLSGDIIDLQSGKHILGVIRDITDQKRTEELRRISEEMFSRAFHLGSVARSIIRISDGSFINVNEAFLNLFGYTRNEVIGHTSVELKMWTLEEREKLTKKQSLTGSLKNFELTTWTKSGLPVTGLFSSSQMEISGEACLITSFNDISDRKKIERNLSESEERLRLATEQSGVAVWEYDFASDSMSRSPNHDKLYGLEWQTLWNLNTFLNAIHPDDRAFSAQMIQKSVLPGGPDKYQFVFRVIFPDKVVHWLQVTGLVAKRNEKGEGILVRGTLIDISHIKKTQELLQSSEKKFVTLFKSAAMPVILERRDDSIIADVNDAWLKIFEYDRENVIGRKLSELGYLDSKGTEKVKKNPRPGTDTHNGMEFTLFKKSGIPVEVISDMNVVEIDGIEYNLISLYNITDRKIAEERLAKQTRLYSVLSKVNELLVREKNTELLFHEICRNIVTYGDFRMAWVGLPGKEKKIVNPVACFGHEEGYLKIMLFSGDPGQAIGSGPTGKTIRSGNYSVCNDIANDPLMEPWREEALKRGYRSSMAVALKQSGQVKGTLNLYSEIPGFFDDSEIKLLVTLAENISYSLDSIEFEKQNKENEKALIESRNHYEIIFEHSVVPIWEEDFSAVKSYLDRLKRDGVKDFPDYFSKNPSEITHCASLIRIIDINQTSVRFFGLSNKSEVILSLPEYFYEDSLPALAGEFSALAEGMTQYETIVPIRYQDGTKKHLFIQLRVIPDNLLTLSRVLVSWIDITDRINYEEELRKSREELRNLALHLETIRESERKSIAMNLHDDLGQKLTAIKMDLNWLKSKPVDSRKEMEKRLTGLMELVDDSVGTVQKISSELRPAILYDLGLKDAVEWQFGEFSRSTGINCSLHIVPEEFTLDENLSVTVFRILQEALTNVARHSSATEVTLNLEVTDSAIKILLSDNGKGIDPEKLRNHSSFGLISMRERAEALSGRIEVSGVKDKGTKVKLEIPITHIPD